MTHDTRTRRRVPLRLMGLLIAALLAGCTPAPLPPPTATPEQIVLAWVEASKQGDCATVRALTRPGRPAWCSSFLDSDAQIGGVEIVKSKPQPTGRNDSLRDWSKGYVVHTTLTISRGGVSMPAGQTPWSFWLGRQASDERWVVVDWGR